MKSQFAPIVVLIAVILSLAALAQTGTAAAGPGAAAPGAASPVAAPPASSAPAAPAAATPAIPSFNKLGIINIQGAIMASNEGRRDLEALDKKFDPKRTELQNLSKELEDLKKQLSTQGDKMNEEARGNLVRNLETKQKQLQRSSEDAQNEYQQQQNEIGQRVGSKIMVVLDKFARDNGFSVILDVSNPQSPVLWAANTTDVTKPVVDLYNTQSGVPAPASTSSSSTKPNSGTTTPKPASTTTHKPATTTATPAAPPKSQ